jgi:alpha-N-arabinofuranosidase
MLLVAQEPSDSQIRVDGVLTSKFNDIGSFFVKGSYSGNFTASLRSFSNTVLRSIQIVSMATSSAHTQHNFILTPTAVAAISNNTFCVTYDASISRMLLTGRAKLI